MNNTAREFVNDLSGHAEMEPAAPVTFELSDGTTYGFDPDNGPYLHEGRLVVPIVEAD